MQDNFEHSVDRASRVCFEGLHSSLFFNRVAHMFFCKEIKYRKGYSLHISYRCSVHPEVTMRMLVSIVKLT
jgi:hypothetical protein